MKLKSTQTLLILAVLLLSVGLVTLGLTQAHDGNYYNFDYEDFWKEYREFGYPAGSRLPCNGGGSEAYCTWAWEPWYKHGTDIPRFWVEQWDGRTVSGYAMLFQSYTSSHKNLHGGIYRQETVTPCHTYRFTMYSRSGLDEQHPAPPNAQMRVGISPTGLIPGEIVLIDSDIDAITWSAPSNSQYAYENLSVEATAQGNTITVFTRAQPDPQNDIYIFWDEGSFSEVPRTDDLLDPTAPLPGATGYIYNINAVPSSTSATISWNTGSYSTMGQVLYRRVSQGSVTPPETYTNTTYLPLVMGGTSGDWSITSLLDWNTNHQAQLTGLSSGVTYEYVIVSYGYIEGSCQTLVSNTSTPNRFTTP